MPMELPHRSSFFVPTTEDNGAKATVLVCVCSDGTALVPSVVDPGASNRPPYMYDPSTDESNRTELPPVGAPAIAARAFFRGHSESFQMRTRI